SRHRGGAVARSRGRSFDRALRRSSRIRRGGARSRGPFTRRCSRNGGALPSARPGARHIGLRNPGGWADRPLALPRSMATLPSVRSGWVLLVAVVAALVSVSSAGAAGWLPHAADATWTYQWTDSAYNTTPTNELVSVKSTTGSSFTLAWTTKDAGTPDAPQSVGTVSFQETNFGLVNTDWQSSPPPSSFPILCPTLG